MEWEYGRFLLIRCPRLRLASLNRVSPISMNLIVSSSSASYASLIVDAPNFYISQIGLVISLTNVIYETVLELMNRSIYGKSYTPLSNKI